MKQIVIATVGLALMAIFISSAQAVLKIETATVQGGMAFIKGTGAVKGAQITWEGIAVTTANKTNGGFSFVGILPDDCTGELKDTAATIQVAVLRCTRAAPAPVPKTGQTTSFAAGDDGARKKGVASPNPRFTDNGNGTVTDNLTGLIWLTNANCPNGTRTWQGALDFVAGINTGVNNCGDTSNAGLNQTDWRLPNIRELHSLVNFAFSNPAISDAAGTGPASSSNPFSPFNDCINDGCFYWSSTTFADFSDLAWGVDFFNGFVFSAGKGSLGFVTAVRGGS